jgi:hypothetical protein
VRSRRGGRLPAPVVRGDLPARFHPDDEHQTVFALLGGSTRRGSWEPAAVVDCTAILGGIQLDLREADLIEGTTTLRCLALWAGIEIVVPPDVDVDADGTGILGGFDHVDHRAPEGDVPLVRIEGTAVMGGVSVRVKDRKAPQPPG